MSEQALTELLAKNAIHDTLCRYCRGLDRMDKEMAYSVWHEDGTALYHDMYKGTGHGFVDWVWETHAGMERHSHQIANSLIEVDGNTARSETYVTIVLWTNLDSNGRQQEIVGKGRYLDHWSYRNGRWAISHREHVLDMQTLHDLNRGYINEVSRRDKNDPSFQLIAKYPEQH